MDKFTAENNVRIDTIIHLSYIFWSKDFTETSLASGSVLIIPISAMYKEIVGRSATVVVS